MCGDSGNQFYNLEVARTQLAVAGSIMIGGQRKQVQRIMTFKMGWINRNWANPIKVTLADAKA